MQGKGNKLETKKEFRIFGFHLDEKKLFGFIIIGFAISYFLAGEFYKINKLSYKNALPYEQRKEGQYTFVTGKILAEDIGSENIQSGKYYLIKEESEIYAWVPGSGLKHDTKPKYQWTDAPIDPIDFHPYGSGQNKKFHKKSIHLKNVLNQTTHILVNNKKIPIPVEKFDLSREDIFQLEKPDVKSITSTRFNKFAKREYFDKSKLLVYDSENCEFEFGDDTKAGCERILLSVLKIPDQEYTFVGIAKGEDILPDGETIMIYKGDYANFQDFYSSDDSARGFFIFMGQIILFFGLWIGVYLSRNTFTNWEFLSERSDKSKSFIVSTLAFVFLKTIFHFWWGLILVPMIVYIWYLRTNQSSQKNL